ncbi:wall-associated receptor kinase 2-like [Tripterygium wilfordii]|uniref:wall-associated receptor kinase 2-like n=1 Tax=Tripterygium wilfordii TaxID=458696 RepID=UPI0018F81C40|nr:wall-associated receptor kinase 2-like [Tripterygium wilfordii]
MWLVWLVLPWISPTTNAAKTFSNTKPGCLENCGNVSAPFPFGIDNLDCAINDYFLLDCNATNTTTPELLFGNMIVSNISVEEGTISVYINAASDCYDQNGRLENDSFDEVITLGDGPFRFSATRNKFTAFGCDTSAYMSDSEGSFTSGCISLCDPQNMTKDDSCSGIGCCQTTVPRSLKTLNITVGSFYNHSDILKFNPCGYAFLVDQNSFNASDFGLANYSDASVAPPAVIEWVVKEETCEKAQTDPTTYACSNNTRCDYSENGQGYRCLCEDGFKGNPYLLQGCEDIDECKEPEKYPCQGHCKNTIGNYTCNCPLGMRGDGKFNCHGFRITTIATVSAAVILLVIISLLIFIILKRRRKEKYFLENGGVLLKHQRVRIFSEKELMKATNNYDTSQFLGEGGFGSVYKGILADNIQVAVKMPKGLDKAQVNKESQHEIGIVSQVNHKNVVKLLGLCLETKVPLLVYEFIPNGTLYQHLHDKKSRILKTWKTRLRIAAEMALALDYLHSLASPPIIHSDIKSTNVLLDDNYTAKVSDFGASVLISADKTVIATKIQGTFGYLDPEYLMTGNLTEKSDVYSFGIVLLELLTGENPCSSSRSKERGSIIHYFVSSLESNSLFHILDFKAADDDEMEEIEVVAELAKRCVDSSGVRRPTMKEVAEELARLMKLHVEMSAQQDSEETQHLLGESSYPFHEIASAKANQPDTYTVSRFDIESYADSI